MSIFGLDEHTACIIDLEKEKIRIKGIGRVILRKGGAEISFEKGECYPLEVLRGEYVGKEWQQAAAVPSDSEQDADIAEDSFWDNVHALQAAFQDGLEKNTPEEATSTLLDLDGTIWKAQQELENAEFISQAREILRDMVALLGMRLASSPRS